MSRRMGSIKSLSQERARLTALPGYRSGRISSKDSRKSVENQIVTAQPKLDSMLLSSMITSLSLILEAPDPIRPYTLPCGIQFVPRKFQRFAQEISEMPDDIISNIAWVPCLSESSESIEGKLLSTCSGMFGVMSFFYSTIIHHRERLRASNHHWLYDAKNYSQFAGDSLVMASTPADLFIAVLHAAIGKDALSLNSPRTQALTRIS